MKRATSIVILGALVVGMVSAAAGARARAQDSAAETSDRHSTRRMLHTTTGAPAASHLASSTLSVEVNGALSEPVGTPETIDWGNPYDLILHGIKPGKTRDMRPLGGTRGPVAP